MLFHTNAEIENGDSQVKEDAIRIGNYTDGQFPTDSKEFAKRIFYTVYMGTENRFAYITYLLSVIDFLIHSELFALTTKSVITLNHTFSFQVE